PLLLHVGPIALRGVQALLLEGQAHVIEGIPERLQTAGETAPLLELFQGGVGVLTDQGGQALQVGRSQGRGRSTSVRFGGEGAGVAAALEQADDEGGADAEDAGDPADRALVAIDGACDPLAKVQRIGTHGGNLLPRLWISKSSPLSNYSRVQPGSKPL